MTHRRLSVESAGAIVYHDLPPCRSARTLVQANSSEPITSKFPQAKTAAMAALSPKVLVAAGGTSRD